RGDSRVLPQLPFRACHPPTALFTSLSWLQSHFPASANGSEPQRLPTPGELSPTLPLGQLFLTRQVPEHLKSMARAARTSRAFRGLWFPGKCAKPPGTSRTLQVQGSPAQPSPLPQPVHPHAATASRVVCSFLTLARAKGDRRATAPYQTHPLP